MTAVLLDTHAVIWLLHGDRRLSLSALQTINAISQRGSQISREIIAALLNITRDEVPDMPDRVIAATAAHLGIPLISHDARITASYIQTIW